MRCVTLGLRDAQGPIDFFRQRATAGAVMMTKDSELCGNAFGGMGPPPKVLWVTCGNTSNAQLRTILSRDLPACCRPNWMAGRAWSRSAMAHRGPGMGGAENWRNEVHQ